MINAIIHSNDGLFRKGMMHCLQDLVFQKYGKEISFSYEMDENDIARANIIVLTLFPGEQYTCRPELQNWRQGLLILFSEASARSTGWLPDCFANCVMPRLNDPLDYIYSMIKKNLNLVLMPSHLLPAQCQFCRARNMSRQQRQIIDGMFSGLSIERIAHQMNLAPKTVYAHKYSVMRKFELRGEYELMAFYKTQRNKYPLNVQREDKMIIAVREER